MKRFLFISKKIASLLIVVALFSSCQGWLEIAPEKYLIKDNFWKKTEDVNNALAAVYSSVRNTTTESFKWGEVRGDMISGIDATIAGSDILTTNGNVNWDKYYSTINLANTLMYYTQSVVDNDKSFTKRMKDGIDAEAMFLRSLSYFYLVRVWKEVPLITNPSISDTCDVYPRKSSEAVIINQIIKDLLSVKDKAWDKEFIADPKLFKGRVNKYTIMALLADVYLWNEQYQKCVEYCDEIINSNLYAMETWDTWYNIYNPGNSIESIFEIQCDDDGTEDMINPMYKQIISLSSSRANMAFATRYNTVFPDLTDVRTCQNAGSFYKYFGITYTGEIMRSGTSQRDMNVLYYRLADIYLMKAEALNELDQVDAARDNVLITAVRAGVSVDILTNIYNTTTRIEMRDIILDERARESVAEGKRWFDLLRAAKRNHFELREYVTNVILINAAARSKEVISSKINDTMMYYLPINYSELKRNKNLTQNPFYER